MAAVGNGGRRGERIAELALELEQQALGGLLADAGHLDEAAGLLQADGLRELVDAQPRQDRQSGAWADTGNLHELAKRRTLIVGQEAEQHLRVFADDEMSQQGDPLAERRQVVEAAHRNVDLIADAVHVDEQLRRRFFREGACQSSDHGGAGAKGEGPRLRGSTSASAGERAGSMPAREYALSAGTAPAAAPRVPLRRAS